MEQKKKPTPEELLIFWEEMHTNTAFESYVTWKSLIAGWENEIKTGNFSITKDKDDKSFERIDRFLCNRIKYEELLTNLYQKLNPTEQTLANASVENLIESARKELKRR